MEAYIYLIQNGDLFYIGVTRNLDKTKDLLNMLTLLDINNEKLIILSGEDNKSIYLSSRNLKNVKSKNVNSFSTCDVADSSFLLLDKTSVDYLNEKLV